MAQLKAGRVADFADSMAAAIEQTLGEEWQAIKGAPLPAAGQEDRRLLFAAIAGGVLRYLKAHEDEIFTSITLETGGAQTTHPVKGLGLNVPGP